MKSFVWQVRTYKAFPLAQGLLFSFIPPTDSPATRTMPWTGKNKGERHIVEGRGGSVGWSRNPVHHVRPVMFAKICSLLSEETPTGHGNRRRLENRQPAIILPAGLASIGSVGSSNHKTGFTFTFHPTGPFPRWGDCGSPPRELRTSRESDSR
jgi:hypothetical protein